MRFTIHAVKTNDDSGGLVGFLEGRGEALLKLLPRGLCGQREVQILREAVVPEVALLERRPALERQPVPQRAAGEPNQEPRKAVVALQDGLRDAPTSLLGESIGQQGEIALRNHRLGLYHGPKLF